jgi:hypothetical protein
MLRKMVDADYFSLFFAGKFCDQFAVDVKNPGRKCRVKFSEVFVVDYVFCI